MIPSHWDGFSLWTYSLSDCPTGVWNKPLPEHCVVYLKIYTVQKVYHNLFRKFPLVLIKEVCNFFGHFCLQGYFSFIL